MGGRLRAPGDPAVLWAAGHGAAVPHQPHRRCIHLHRLLLFSRWIHLHGLTAPLLQVNLHGLDWPARAAAAPVSPLHSRAVQPSSGVSRTSFRSIYWLWAPLLLIPAATSSTSQRAVGQPQGLCNGRLLTSPTDAAGIGPEAQVAPEALKAPFRAPFPCQRAGLPLRHRDGLQLPWCALGSTKLTPLLYWGAIQQNCLPVKYYSKD